MNFIHSDPSISPPQTKVLENTTVSERPKKRVTLGMSNLSWYEVVYIAQYLPTYVLGIFARLNQQGVTFMTPALLHRMDQLYVGKDSLEAWYYLRAIHQTITHICKRHKIEGINISNFEVFAKNIANLSKKTIFNIFSDESLYFQRSFKCNYTALKAVSYAELLRIRPQSQQRDVCPVSLLELGSKALWYAAKANRPEIIQLLLQLGADVNVPDGKGEYPLHRAVQESCVDAVTLLIEAGANVNILDKGSGISPLDFACGLWSRLSTQNELKRHKIKQLLIQHGATCSRLCKAPNPPSILYF